MKKIIIYGSHYGSSKKYAQKLSEMTGISVLNYKNIRVLSAYNEIIHIGGLYAGSVKGLKKTVRAMPQNAKLMIVTVGLADTANQKNIRQIKSSVHKQVPESMLNRTKILHLRGGMDYNRLSFLHKVMMSYMYKKTRAIPQVQRTAEDKGLLATYRNKVDYIDFDGLKQVMDFISSS